MGASGSDTRCCPVTWSWLGQETHQDGEELWVLVAAAGGLWQSPVWHWTSLPWRELIHAADVLWTYSSELHEVLVLHRGMPLRQHGRFAADAMISALLPSEQPDTRP